MKMLRVSVYSYTIVDELEVDVSKRHGGLYYSTNKGFIPVVYLYPVEKREEVESLLAQVREAQKVYAGIFANIFHIKLPALRKA